MDSGFNICHVCNKSMNDPRILSCAHSFCLQCLETSTISKESSKCPTCQMEFEIPQGGLKDLKKNEFISKLHGLKQSFKICNSCDKNQATKYCVDCSYSFCLSCLDCHKNIPASKNHQITKLKAKPDKVENKKSVYAAYVAFFFAGLTFALFGCFFTSEIDAKQEKVENTKVDYEVCVDHGEAKTLYCNDCNNIICGKCLVLNHGGHKIMHISEYFEEMKEKLDDDINAKELILPDVAYNYESSKNFKNENERKANELKKEIEKRGREMKTNIDSVVEELKQNVDERLKEYNKEADDVLLKLENLNKNINAHIETLTQHLKHLKDKKFIETSKKTLEVKFENIPKYDEYFDLTLSYDKIENEIKSIFGRIIEESSKTTYQFTVNISSMTQVLYSPKFFVRQLPWYLRIDPYCITNDEDSKKYLGIFLYWDWNSKFKGWSCNAKFKFKLLSNKPDSDFFGSYHSASFVSGGNGKGITFIKMDELLDPNNGYMKDGSVTFEVYVKADEPKGV